MQTKFLPADNYDCQTSQCMLDMTHIFGQKKLINGPAKSLQFMKYSSTNNAEYFM